MHDSNIVRYKAAITREKRAELNGHHSSVIWFTGLSGSGKSSLAHAVEEQLYKHDCRTYVLDGDNVRHGLCGNLGFSNEDRSENIRRIAEVAKLFVEAGVITLTAFISPFRADRDRARNLFPHGDFIEIFCNCPLEVCEERDVKGLYQRARLGEVKDFTGITSPYEPPVRPELIINTATQNLNDSVFQVLDFLVKRGIIPSINQ